MVSAMKISWSPAVTVFDALAFDGGEHAGDERHAGLARIPFHAVEAVLPLAREVLGNVPLLLAQHVDAEALRRAEVAVDAGGVADGDEDQRRLERNRSERADRDAVGRALAVDYGGNRYAGCETPAGGAKLVFPEACAEGARSGLLDIGINSILS